MFGAIHQSIYTTSSVFNNKIDQKMTERSDCMLNKLTTKSILSLVALFVAVFVIGMIGVESRASADGHINLIIEDADGVILYDEALPYFEGETFYDVLKRTFSLTCANASYQPDETCSYAFVLGPQINGSSLQSDKVILGIQGDAFELMTNWTDDFLAFEVLKDDSYILTSQGPSNMHFENGQTFRIKVKSTQSSWGNGS
jgi:hypothetical protein